MAILVSRYVRHSDSPSGMKPEVVAVFTRKDGESESGAMYRVGSLLMSNPDLEIDHKNDGEIIFRMKNKDSGVVAYAVRPAPNLVLNDLTFC